MSNFHKGHLLIGGNYFPVDCIKTLNVEIRQEGNSVVRVICEISLK